MGPEQEAEVSVIDIGDPQFADIERGVAGNEAEPGGERSFIQVFGEGGAVRMDSIAGFGAGVAELGRILAVQHDCQRVLTKVNVLHLNSLETPAELLDLRLFAFVNENFVVADALTDEVGGTGGEVVQMTPEPVDARLRFLRRQGFPFALKDQVARDLIESPKHVRVR